MDRSLARRPRPACVLGLATLPALWAAAPALGAQNPVRVAPWAVEGFQKLSSTQGGLGPLQNGGYFGLSMASIGDLDGDGLPELVVGAPGENARGTARGAIHVLFLNPDGTVRAQQLITEFQGGFSSGLDDFDYFGRGVWSLGDLDDDGNEDLIVGAYRDDDGGFDAGAVYILFMNPDGTVDRQQKISNLGGGTRPVLLPGDLFGVRACALGDLDGDGVEDAAVSASFDDDGGEDRGAVYVLFLKTDGTSKGFRKISQTQGGFGGQLDDFDHFGTSVASPGDVDGDGIQDLAVGARADGDGGPGRGAVWILFLEKDGGVRDWQKISDTEGGFAGELGNSDNFGISLAPLGDPDGDGRVSLAVGAFQDDDGQQDAGAVWLLDLDRDGTVLHQRKLSNLAGGPGGGAPAGLSLGFKENFGTGLALLGDLDGSGRTTLAVGAWNDDDGGVFGGAAYVFELSTRRRAALGDRGATTARAGLGALADARLVLVGLGGLAQEPQAVPGLTGELALLPPYLLTDGADAPRLAAALAGRWPVPVAQALLFAEGARPALAGPVPLCASP